MSPVVYMAVLQTLDKLYIYIYISYEIKVEIYVYDRYENNYFIFIPAVLDMKPLTALQKCIYPVRSFDVPTYSYGQVHLFYTKDFNCT